MPAFSERLTVSLLRGLDAEPAPVLAALLSPPEGAASSTLRLSWLPGLACNKSLSMTRNNLSWLCSDVRQPGLAFQTSTDSAGASRRPSGLCSPSLLKTLMSSISMRIEKGIPCIQPGTESPQPMTAKT